MYLGIYWLPSSIISQHGKIIKLLATFIIVIGCSWSLSSCDTGSKPSLFSGTWTGYLSLGSNDSGYNTTTISDKRTCCLIAEISGELPQWGGPYRLLIEGEPDLDASGYIFGEITITRYRTGQDTTQTMGIWSGSLYLESNVGNGQWYTASSEPFNCSGVWMAVKK